MSLPGPESSADPPELQAFARFCSNLSLTQGSAFELEPFQRLILRDYFSGVRETLILLSKKNGKTTLLGALALFHLTTTPDAECVIGASSRDQASILYDQARGFVRRSEGLQKRVVPKAGYREIRSLRDMGRIRVLAADSDTADGVIPTLALVDELGRHKKPDLYGVFRDGLGPRDGQLVGISAAGDFETSPLGVIRAAAHRLPATREGKYLYARADDQTFALHEWALDPDDDLENLELVKQVNPASWQTLEKLGQRKNSPSMLPWQWARFACGIWTAAEATWIDPAEWYGQERDEAFSPGDKIAIGFDGSRFGDATAIVGCRLEDGLLQLLGCWEAPPGAKDWEVPANEVDLVMSEVMEDYKVVRGYFDPPLWQSEIDQWSREFGEQLVMRYHTARARMMLAVERFRTDLAAGKLAHAGDKTLTEHVLGAQLKESRGGYWVTKGDLANDAAIAAVLAYEARCDALAAGVETKRGYAFL